MNRYLSFRGFTSLGPFGLNVTAWAAEHSSSQSISQFLARHSIAASGNVTLSVRERGVVLAEDTFTQETLLRFAFARLSAVYRAAQPDTLRTW